MAPASNRGGTKTCQRVMGALLGPFIEDLRGTPGRLVHPECFADEPGLAALVSLVTDHDRRMRLELARRWSAETHSQPRSALWLGRHEVAASMLHCAWTIGTAE